MEGEKEKPTIIICPTNLLSDKIIHEESVLHNNIYNKIVTTLFLNNTKITKLKEN